MDTTDVVIGEEIFVYIPIHEYDARVVKLDGTKGIQADDPAMWESGQLVSLKDFLKLSKIKFPRTFGRQSVFTDAVRQIGRVPRAKFERDEARPKAVRGDRLVDLPIEVLQEIYKLKTSSEIQVLRDHPDAATITFQPLFGCHTRTTQQYDVELRKEVIRQETTVYLPARLVSHMVNQQIFEETAPVVSRHSQFILHDTRLADVRQIIDKRQPLLGQLLEDAIQHCTDLVVSISSWDRLFPIVQDSTQWKDLSRVLVKARQCVMLTFNSSSRTEENPYSYELQTADPVTGQRYSLLLETADLTMHDNLPFNTELHAAIHNHVHQTQLVKEFVRFGRERPQVNAQLRFKVRWCYHPHPYMFPEHLNQLTKVSLIGLAYHPPC
jgi:hypothetical protein